MSTYSVIIVNWNAGNWLRQCVDAILAGKDNIALSEIIVVDNASTDNSLLTLPADSRIRQIRNKENKGFAAACNQGIKATEANYVVMINPDLLVSPDTLQQCHAFMQENRQIDICGVRQKNEQGATQPSCARFPTPLRFLFDALGLSKLAPSLFKPATLMTDWDHNSSAYVNQIMGSFMFIRRAALNQIGLFDEAFFVYYEELDLSKRLADAGGKSYYISSMEIMHAGGGTTHSVKSFRLYLSLQSRLVYARKHFTKAGYFFTAMVTHLLEPFTRTLFALIKGSPIQITETWKAYNMLWRGGLKRQSQS